MQIVDGKVAWLTCLGMHTIWGLAEFCGSTTHIGGFVKD